MKKFVYASAMALTSLGFVFAPMLQAQGPTIQIHDPAEFNAYQGAFTQSDPSAKAEALESFLQAYPQSVVKSVVLDMLIDIYQKQQDTGKTLSAASRQLEVDPNNMKAIFISVFILKNRCVKTGDAQSCNDAASLAQRGLAAPQPASTSDSDWKRITDATYPVYRAALGLKAGSAESRNAAAPSSGVHFGFQVRPVIQDDVAALGLTSTKGLVVTSVENGSLADTMGVLAGDVILQVNGADVGDMQQFVQTVRSGVARSFRVWRKGQTVDLTVPQSL
jgi:hypothetical protein